MIVKYQDKFWLYHGVKDGELLRLTHLGTGKTVDASSREIEIMKTSEQLAVVSEAVKERKK